MTITYTDACRYATVLARDNDPKDLVHNAFLYHHNLTGGNIFDQPKGYVLRTIKHAWRRRYRATQYIRKGELITPEWVDPDNLTGGLMPDEILMSGEFVENFHKKVNEYKQKTGRPMPPNALPKFLKYLEEGYSISEISEMMDMQPARLHKYTAKLKTFAKQMSEVIPHNPFNASKVKVIKVVKKETYDKHPEKYEEFTYDTDRGADINEWYLLLVNKEGEGLLVRGMNESR